MSKKKKIKKLASKSDPLLDKSAKYRRVAKKWADRGRVHEKASKKAEVYDRMYQALHNKTYRDYDRASTVAETKEGKPRPANVTDIVKDIAFWEDIPKKKKKKNKKK
tara:strand:- start:505 stop:825 length:321 start_codon:yes stop_codon:yes gene_type:complete